MSRHTPPFIVDHPPNVDLGTVIVRTFEGDFLAKVTHRVARHLIAQDQGKLKRGGYITLFRNTPREAVDWQWQG